MSGNAKGGSLTGKICGRGNLAKQLESNQRGEARVCKVESPSLGEGGEETCGSPFPREKGRLIPQKGGSELYKTAAAQTQGAI